MDASLHAFSFPQLIKLSNMPNLLIVRFTHTKFDLNINCAGLVTYYNWPAELTPLYPVLAVSGSSTPESREYEAAEDSLLSGCLLLKKESRFCYKQEAPQHY